MFVFSDVLCVHVCVSGACYGTAMCARMKNKRGGKGNRKPFELRKYGKVSRPPSFRPLSTSHPRPGSESRRTLGMFKREQERGKEEGSCPTLQRQLSREREGVGYKQKKRQCDKSQRGENGGAESMQHMIMIYYTRNWGPEREGERARKKEKQIILR